jgi:hypothetical protein
VIETLIYMLISTGLGSFTLQQRHMHYVIFNRSAKKSYRGLFAVASLSSFRGSASRGYTLVASIYYQNSDIYCIFMSKAKRKKISI